jgi:hypothetical protein
MRAAFDRTGQIAMIGGFVSELGLATGPLVGGFPIVNNHHSLLIDVSVAVLALSAVAALIPAALLDRSSKSGRVIVPGGSHVVQFRSSCAPHGGDPARSLYCHAGLRGACRQR